MTAATTRATSNAHPKLSTSYMPSIRSLAAWIATAFSTSTRMKLTPSMKGSRSDATIGGRIAFRMATAIAIRSAAPRLFTVTPGSTRAGTTAPRR